MIDPDLQAKGKNLLFVVAQRAIEYARKGNKSGLIRLRYVAMHIAELLPFSGLRRLTDQTDDHVSLPQKATVKRPNDKLH